MTLTILRQPIRTNLRLLNNSNQFSSLPTMCFELSLLPSLTAIIGPILEEFTCIFNDMVEVFDLNYTQATY
jgi:hypothetical protein